MKALGTGWSQGIQWKDIEALIEFSDAPRQVLHNKAQELAIEKGVSSS